MTAADRRPARLILFDIDGTLLMSRGAGRRAILAAMTDLLPASGEALDAVRFDGKTDPQIVVELLAAAGVPAPDRRDRIQLVLDRYVACLERELDRPDHRTDVLPGIAGLLDRIERTSEAVLGLLTGNVKPGARLKLRSAALDPDRFRVGAFGCDHRDRSALPRIAARRAASLFGREPGGESVVIIGDTPADVTCGVSIGARAIGVATGSYSAEELRLAGAFAAFDDLADPATVWEAIWA